MTRSHDPDFWQVTPLESFPPMEKWDDWVEYEAKDWPRKVEHRYMLVPTTCFNCEAACGLIAYVDKETRDIRKLEGNPHHPGSRGKNCAKGPATLNQIQDPGRILYPLKRVGPRGSGQFERTTWDEVLDTFAAKIRKAIVEDRKTEVMYHVGRPGHDGYMDRVLQSWGVDGHNSHTNVCSAAARLGYALWTGADRPSPDHEFSKFMLLLSSHLETGHYFNPHAQRIIEAKSKGAKLAVIDVRLSNTASMADYWMAPWPGTEAMLLLAMVHVILEENLFDREFVETWVNWREFLAALDAGTLDPGMLGVMGETTLHQQASAKSASGADCAKAGAGVDGSTTSAGIARVDKATADRAGTKTAALDVTRNDNSIAGRSIAGDTPKTTASAPSSSEPATFERFVRELKRVYAFATPEAAEKECGVAQDTIVEVARGIGAAKGAFASHVWRNAASGNLGGWQVARCLEFLCVLVGSVGAKGGTNLNSQDKFVPPPFLKPPPQNVWSDLLYPREYPLAHHELSYLLPHMLLEGRGKISAYFTRVYNPVWTNPDGMVWEQVLRDESKIELHAALSPTWSETAQYADYVLPVGLGAERHDLMSQETHAAKWISFRQPVQRVMRERLGEKLESTRDANPGEVWEEDEFWIALSWRIDPDGSLGIRKFYESPYRPGQRITVDEYYGWIFENSVPGLPAEAKKKGMTPLEYMRRHGAFLVEKDTYEGHMKKLGAAELDGSTTDGTTKTVMKNGKPIGVIARNSSVGGFTTPSRRLEIFSQTMIDWGWPEQSLPGYIESHIHRKHLDASKGEYALIPTFRLPTLIHTRSGNSKWLYELSNTNPVWIHPEDAARIGVETTDLVRISTRIGYYVNKAWVTEGMRPGVVACSHHLGRWRLFDDVGADKWASTKVMREETAPGRYRFRRLESIHPFKSTDPDSKRVWWTDGGVHQNLTFPVQPDPISGMHCWHQRVKVERAHAGDRYGDVEVDTKKSMEVYREWLALTRKGPRPGGLRRPLHFARAVRPSADAYRM